MLSSSLRLRRVVREASRGRTREWAGRRRTSSKVSAFWIARMFSARKVTLYASAFDGQNESRYCQRHTPFRRSSAMKITAFVSLTAALAALSFAQPSLAQQYKWVDKDGR